MAAPPLVHKRALASRGSFAWRQQSLRPQAQLDRARLCGPARLLDEPLLILDFSVDFRLMIEIARQGGVDLGGFQVRVVNADLVRRPAVVQEIDYDLRHAD